MNTWQTQQIIHFPRRVCQCPVPQTVIKKASRRSRLLLIFFFHDENCFCIVPEKHVVIVRKVKRWRREDISGILILNPKMFFLFDSNWLFSDVAWDSDATGAMRYSFFARALATTLFIVRCMPALIVSFWMRPATTSLSRGLQPWTEWMMIQYFKPFRVVFSWRTSSWSQESSSQPFLLCGSSFSSLRLERPGRSLPPLLTIISSGCHPCLQHLTHQYCLHLLQLVLSEPHHLFERNSSSSAGTQDSFKLVLKRKRT